MTSSPDTRPPAAVVGEGYERGAERLLEAIGGACEQEVGFPAQVEAGLRATLALFAADPVLARLLAVRPYGGGEEALRAYQRGLMTYGSLLRRAAAGDPGVVAQPDFVEPALIGGIAWQIASRLFRGGDEEVEGLLSSLLEFVFACYYGPDEGVRLTRAALGTGVSSR